MQLSIVSHFLALLLLCTSTFALRPFRGNEIIRTLNSLSLIYIDLTYLISTPSSLIERWSRVTDVEFAYENGTYAAVPWKPFNHSSQYDIQAAHHNLIVEEIRFLYALMAASELYDANDSKSIFALADLQYEVSFNFFNSTYFVGPDMFDILSIDEGNVMAILLETREVFLSNFGKRE